MEEKTLHLLRLIIEPHTEKIMNHITEQTNELKKMIQKQSDEFHQLKKKLEMFEKMDSNQTSTSNGTDHNHVKEEKKIHIYENLKTKSKSDVFSNDTKSAMSSFQMKLEELKKLTNSQSDPLIEKTKKVPLGMKKIPPTLSQIKRNVLAAIDRDSQGELFLLQKSKSSLPRIIKEEAFVEENWKLDYDKLEFDEEVAVGGFGEIYKGKYNGNLVAIKKMKIMSHENYVNTFEDEVKLLSSLKHNNVLSLFGATTFPSYSIVLPFMENGDLDFYLRDTKKKIGPIDWKTRLRFSIEIADGMTYLHNLNPRIIHRDLKTDNVLLDKNLTCKISDFGITKLKESKIKIDPKTLKEKYGIDLLEEKEKRGFLSTYVMPEQKIIGAFPFIAPEIISKKPYNELSDCYSYGHVLFHILTRKNPLHLLSVEEKKEFRSQMNKSYEPPLPEWLPSNCSSLITNLWQHVPVERNSFQEIFKKLNSFKNDPSPHIPEDCI